MEYRGELDNQETKLQKIIEQIPEQGIAPLLTYGVPEMCTLIIKNEGTQKGTDMYFYPYDIEIEDINVVIDKKLQQKLTDLFLQKVEGKDKQIINKLINVFTKGTKVLNKNDCLVCKFSGSIKGTLISLKLDKTELNFILETKIDVSNIRHGKKPKYKVSKNLISNSVSLLNRQE